MLNEVLAAYEVGRRIGAAIMERAQVVPPPAPQREVITWTPSPSTSWRA